ncbi:hypothetical protein ACIPXV_02895 [Streptomyces libani]|uniref:hypothetical protein n=1 Tax=Streptomyces nigrescens TaxID=1920 RepID=UPI0037F5F2B3
MTARAPLDWLLDSTARHLPGGNGSAPLTADHLAHMSELAIWDWHGTSDPTPESIADKRALTDALDRLPINSETRGEFAARIQLLAKGAVL